VDVAGCVEGSYRGIFQTGAPPDGGVALKLSGSLEFTLVQEGGEFLHLAPDAKLEGASEDQLTRFSANIIADDCKAGAIESTLTDGVFVVLQTGTDEPAWPTPVSFDGTVSGTYQANTGFVGTWRTTVNGVTALQGVWSAILIPP
jgi:hypothetical protein